MDEVHLLLERVEQPPFSHPKLRCKKVDRRPLYQDFILFINDLCDASDLSIICNSDIYFDSSLKALSHVLRHDQCAALSRWDEQTDGKTRLFDRADSQDAWVFRGRVRSFSCDYLIGVPRCDNRFLYELKEAGYQVLNPGFSVKAIHRHTGIRDEYPAEISGPFVPPPYAYLYPHNLLPLSATLRYRRAHPQSELGWRIDLRRMQRSLPFRAIAKLRRLLSRSDAER